MKQRRQIWFALSVTALLSYLLYMRDRLRKVEARPTSSGKQSGNAVGGTKTVDMFGVKIDALRLDEVLAAIEQTVQKRRRAIVTYVNVHGMNLAYELPWFRAFLNNSEIVFCDGFGVMLGARMLGYTIPERYTPPDWIDRLAALASERNFSLFLVGARAGVVQKAAAKLKTRFPNLNIAGTHDGYFNKVRGHPENEVVLQTINDVSPDILIVGFGMPLQEQWLRDNWDRIDARVALTVGALFDYMTGEVWRAPRFITDNKLEWLARLVVEPRRLGHRYLVGNPMFLMRILKQRFGFGRFNKSAST